MTSPYTEESMLARYRELCAQRDAVYAKTAPLEAKLDKENAAAEKHRVEAQSIAAEIDATLGGAAWIELKKEIASLARFLSKPYGPLATKG